MKARTAASWFYEGLKILHQDFVKVWKMHQDFTRVWKFCCRIVWRSEDKKMRQDFMKVWKFCIMILRRSARWRLPSSWPTTDTSFKAPRTRLYNELCALRGIAQILNIKSITIILRSPCAIHVLSLHAMSYAVSGPPWPWWLPQPCYTGNAWQADKLWCVRKAGP